MPVFKNEDNGTWYVMARYVNWKGERKQKCKRGFATKKEAQEWERMFQLQNSSDLDMSFEAFTELYINDVKNRLKENTWLTKEHEVIGMGRLIGDGMYYMIADIAVCPSFQKKGIGTNITSMLIDYVDSKTPIAGRSSIQLIAEKGKELFYEKAGFKRIPHEHCGSGMRKVIHK